jgi:hypothetical protein
MSTFNRRIDALRDSAPEVVAVSGQLCYTVATHHTGPSILDAIRYDVVTESGATVRVWESEVSPECDEDCYGCEVCDS